MVAVDHEMNEKIEDDRLAAANNEPPLTIDSAQTDSHDSTAEPPNGGYGWVIVFCVFLVNGNSWGINSTYGVFLAHYLNTNTFPGASYLDYAFVGGLSISAAFLVAPLATWTVAHFNTRITLLIGALLEALALVTSSFAQQVWQIFLSQGVCFGIGMGFLFQASVGLPSQWFSTRRNVANGIATGGSGLWAMAYNLATEAMIKHLGLRWAFRILSILTFTFNVFGAFLARDRNKRIGVSMAVFDHRFFYRWEFDLFLAWGVFFVLGYVVLLFSLPSYATSIGLNSAQGALIGALLNLGQGIGRPAVGLCSDVLGPINMAVALHLLCGMLCFCVWVFAKSYGMLIFFSLIVGMTSGTYWTAVAPVGAEVVGLKMLPASLSITWIVLVVPTTFSEAIALKLRRHSGDKYLYTQIFAGTMYIISTMCLFLVRVWKVREKREVAVEEDKRRPHRLRWRRV